MDYRGVGLVGLIGFILLIGRIGLIGRRGVVGFVGRIEAFGFVIGMLMELGVIGRSLVFWTGVSGEILG